MSELSDAVKALTEAAEKNKEITQKTQEVKERQLFLNDKRTALQMEQMLQAEQEMKLARETDFGPMSEEQIASLRQANHEYMEAAKKNMTFICDEFKGNIPFFRKNLIFIGGKTGEGKSTTVANIVFNTIGQKDEATGKRRKVLVITNEEKSEDVINRLTCLKMGWHYTNHDKFSADQLKVFDEYIVKWPKAGVTVIDNGYNGIQNLTTSIEGISSIFDNLIAKEEYYDAVLIDYYQNVKFSKRDPTLDEYKVQAKLASALDIYKNIYPAPIVVMGQVKPNDKDDSTPFEYRIKGRKEIMTVSTCAIEMVADRKALRTNWIIHKSRFNDTLGEAIITGYDKGRFVNNDAEFSLKVDRINAEREAKKKADQQKEFFKEIKPGG